MMFMCARPACLCTCDFFSCIFSQSFNFTGIESLLEELIYHEDIIEWGKANNIWYSFSLLCQISDKMGYNQFAFDLLCILARSAPEKYWQQEAVLKLDEIDGVR